MEDVNVVVERGAQWLDEHYPNWEQNIDFRTLSLSDPHDCVFAQGTGLSFPDGLPDEAIIWSDDNITVIKWASDRGFDSSYDDKGNITKTPWDELRAAWRSVILTRRAYQEWANER